MEISFLTLSKPTSRTVNGPVIKKDADRLLIEYDYELDNGNIEWAQISFFGVLALEYRDGSCCKEESVVSAREVRFVTQSEWLSNVL
jgi:hypothetical protein